VPTSESQSAGSRHDVTVIIPTIGDAKRAETIWRAIDSAGARSGAATRVLVVVNGTRFSPALLGELQSTPRADCLYVEQGSLPNALRRGREQVQSEFFAFLDDDDEFLEGGLTRRAAMLRSQPAAAFVISQGWFHSDGRDTPQTSLAAAQIEADPLGCLLQENWLATSASGLYRSSAVHAADFEQMPHYLEWTYLGFRLAHGRPFRFIDEPTYRRYDMPGSVSKSASFRRGMVAALTKILEIELPAPIRHGLRQKLAQAKHDVSMMALEEGQLREAWQNHLDSLRLPGGLKFLSYTRHLLRPGAFRGA
jgi:Glycosyl transferase family 2